MPIIEDYGTHWLEYHSVPVTTQDAAGAYTSAVIPFSRTGTFLGASMISGSGGGTGDNAQAVGQTSILGSAVALVFGTQDTGFRCRIIKQAGTDGQQIVSMHCLIWLRQTG